MPAFKLFVALALVAGLVIADRQYQAIPWPERVIIWPLLLACLLQVAFWVVASAAWRYLLARAARLRISLADAFIQISLVLVGKYLPGKVWGMFARGAHLAQFDVAPAENIRVTYLEQLISVHAGVGFGLLLWLVASPQDLWLAAAAALVLASFLLVPVYHDRALNFCLPWLERRWPRARAAVSVSGITPGTYWWLSTLYALEWASVGGVLVCLYLALPDAALTPRLACLLLGANAIGMIVGFFAFFTPGGLGVREGVIAAVLAPQLGASEAALLVIMMRLWMSAADMLCGAAVLVSRPSLRGGATGP